VPLALFSFNVGIELGQLALVAVAAPLAWGIGRLPLPRRGFLCELPATALGGIGVYLVLDRTAAWLSLAPL
jgi:hypothetical protein